MLGMLCIINNATLSSFASDFSFLIRKRFLGGESHNESQVHPTFCLGMRTYQGRGYTGGQMSRQAER